MVKSKDGAVTIEQLADNYNVAKSNYEPIFRRMRVLDAVDRNKLWQAIGAKFPKYQILPDTNWVNYIKSNLVASIYTVSKGASILPTSDEDVSPIENVNIALDYIWGTCDVGFFQMQAGSNAALHNVGYTQVGWDPDVKLGKKGNYSKGNVTLSNIHPMKFMRDPFAKDLESAAYCMTWDNYHKSVIMQNTKYAAKFKTFLLSKELGVSDSDPAARYTDRADPTVNSDYYRVFIHFVRYIDESGKEPEVKIAEIHTIENSFELWRNDDVLPRCFPIVELYCNLSENDVVGSSECAKILSNSIAYNMLSSMMLTAEYKNQRPPRYISSSSGLNLQSFTKYGNDADHAFIVNGDASRAVHYHQFPQASATANTMQYGLSTDIQTISGVDSRYTGRDSGSVTTTGGVEDMLNRVSLIDTPKIVNYERYTKNLTKLILANFVEYSLTRTYYKKDVMTGKFKAVEVDYDAIKDSALLSYDINISSELPKNKQRIAAMANILMEKQMQYASTGKQGPDMITAEEWLRLQDLPFKEAMMKRMNIERTSDMVADIADTLFGYAGLIKGGLSADDAINALAQNKMATNRGEQPPVEIPPMADEAYNADPQDQYAPQQDNTIYDPQAYAEASGAPAFDPSMLPADMGIDPGVPAAYDAPSKKYYDDSSSYKDKSYDDNSYSKYKSSGDDFKFNDKTYSKYK